MDNIGAVLYCGGMSKQSVWEQIIAEATTEQTRKAVDDAADNAHATAYDESFETYSDRWYEIAIMTYEYMMDL